jgi:ubiquinone biosynthesis protein UbiJ
MKQSFLRTLSAQLMPQQTLCAAIEFVVNKALSFNINDQDQLSSLEGKSLALNLAEFDFDLCFHVDSHVSSDTTENKILVTTLSESSDCLIRTNIATLKALKNEQQITKLIKEDKLDIEGDIKIAQQFALIAETFDIDWQSELAHHIGDIPTHKLSRLANNISSKVNFAKEQIQSDFSEWLLHEKHIAVPYSQVNRFNQTVTVVATEVEALSLRIEKLQQAVAQNPSVLNTVPTNNKDACE